MLKEYIKRFGICILGLAVFSLGMMLSVLAGSAGTNGWNTLAIGLSQSTPLSFGTATLIISLAVVVIAAVCKGSIGFGTVLNMLEIAFLSDLFLAWFSFIPYAPNQIAGTVYTLLGQTLISFGMVIYMLPGLGCGPRDTLMVIIGKRFPNAPIGMIKFALEAAVLVIGVLLGAPFGVGTVLVITLQAFIFQLACRVCRYEPRDTVHEDIPQTLRRVFGKAQ